MVRQQLMSEHGCFGTVFVRSLHIFTQTFRFDTLRQHLGDCAKSCLCCRIATVERLAQNEDAALRSVADVKPITYPASPDAGIKTCPGGTAVQATDDEIYALKSVTRDITFGIKGPI